MLATKIIGLLSFVFMIGFFAFGFRQWFREKRKNSPSYGPSAGAGTERSDGD